MQQVLPLHCELFVQMFAEVSVQQHRTVRARTYMTSAQCPVLPCGAGHVQIHTHKGMGIYIHIFGTIICNGRPATWQLELSRQMTDHEEEPSL